MDVNRQASDTLGEHEVGRRVLSQSESGFADGRSGLQLGEKAPILSSLGGRTVDLERFK